MEHIELTPVEGSSLIAADGWNDSSTTLTVKYHNGKTYEFKGLSPNIRRGYDSAPSKGKYLKGVIEPNVKGTKI